MMNCDNNCGRCYFIIILFSIIISLSSSFAFTPTISSNRPQCYNNGNRGSSIRSKEEIILYNAIDAEESNGQSEGRTEKKTSFNVVIIGGGWAGYSVAESLSLNIQEESNNENDVSITLVDASKNSGGLAGGFKTKTGRNVEAGIHGFWREYRNTFSIMDRIDGVGAADDSDVLGEYTPSVLYSRNGMVAVAPVLGNQDDEQHNDSTSIPSPSPQKIIQQIIASTISASSSTPSTTLSSNLNTYLPPPLDIALLAQFNPTSPLSTADRVSAIGLLGAWIDFQQESSTSWSIYDKYDARTLFQNKAGVTQSLYEELIEPLLSVLPMCPDYDCSAAAVLSCFHVFALQSKGAFDVKWCRGSIKEKIFDPWYQQLSSRGVQIRNDARVVSIDECDGENDNDATKESKKYCIRINQGRSQGETNETIYDETSIECDAIVLAVGGTAMGMITKNSPTLKSLASVRERDNFEKLRGVTCVAVRLFLKPNEKITSGLKGGEYDKTELPPDVANAMKSSPIAVCGPNPSVGSEKILEETGFCIYDLQRMHDEFSVDKNEGNGERVAVLEIDFYRADKIANMSDHEIAQLALETVAKTFNTKVIDMTENLIDLAIVRARNAVSHFAPNSASYSPGVKLDDGMYICGDWVDRSGHASWSTEKAVVTGIQAATALSNDFDLKSTYSHIIEAAADSTQLESLREIAKVLRKIAPPPDGGIPPSPWSFAQDVLSSPQLIFTPFIRNK